MTPEEIVALEARLPDLDREERLTAMANYVERLPDRFPLPGVIQGECLDLAHRVRELARKLAA